MRHLTKLMCNLWFHVYDCVIISEALKAQANNNYNNKSCFCALAKLQDRNVLQQNKHIQKN